MSRAVRVLTLLPLLALAPALAQAGWIIDWSTTAVNQKGERMAAQRATQTIAGNRVRMQQPEVTTIADYAQDRFTLINPSKQYFWSGSIDEYVSDMSAQRQNAMRDRTSKLPIPQKKKDEVAAKKAADGGKPPTIDLAKLPPVSLSSTGQTEKIAGYDTEKYEAKVDGELFQEIWIAPALDLSSDLDAVRFLAQQQKTGAAMLGKSSKQYNALYNNEQYRALLAKGFVLKTITHHLAGSFERAATSVKQADVPASEFVVPENYRKVRLTDLFDPPPTPASAPRPTGPPEARKPAKLK